jgi:hypothetical protein
MLKPRDFALAHIRRLGDLSLSLAARLASFAEVHRCELVAHGRFDTAADALDHGRAETIEKERDRARRERDHLLARRAGLERRLREAENGLAIAKCVEEAERLRGTIETRNALTVKAAQWAEATIKLGLTLDGDEGDRTRTHLNDQARKLVLELAERGVKIDLPEAAATRLPEEDVNISGENFSSRDTVIIQGRRLMGL